MSRRTDAIEVAIVYLIAALREANDARHATEKHDREAALPAAISATEEALANLFTAERR